MKRSTFILIGVIVFAVVGFFVGSVATNWYSDHFAKSDDDINRSVGIFLVIWLLLAILGGYVGNILFQRNLTKCSSGLR